MGRVLTNNTSLQVAIEATPGVLPGSPVWLTMEPTTISKFGPTLKKVSREPISKNRQLRKAAMVDLDSAVQWECDITWEHVKATSAALLMTVYKGAPFFLPTAVTSTGYTVGSGGAIANGLLVVARGFVNAANNGVKLTAGTSTGTEVKTAGLVVETGTAALNAQLDVCGVRGTAGDIQVNAGQNLISTTLDFTTVPGIIPGAWIWVGGDLGSAFTFANTANRGWCRVKAVTANLVTLDKRPTTFVTDTGATKTIELYVGRYARNVASDSADYLETSLQYELAYRNLQNPGPGDEYEYAAGNLLSSIAYNSPLTDKATMSIDLMGLTTLNPTVTRATNAATALPPVAVAPVSTSVDMARLRLTNVDETGLTTDFKSCMVTVSNTVSPEKVLGNLGAKYMNVGKVTVKVEADLLFSSSDVLKAIRDNRTVTMELGFKNSDFGLVIDIPSMTIEGGDKGFPIDQTVTIKSTSTAFQDATYNDSVSMTLFPYLPAA